MVYSTNFKFGGSLFSKIMPNFCRPHAMSIFKIHTAISLKPYHFIGKLKLILMPLVRNSITHLTRIKSCQASSFSHFFFWFLKLNPFQWKWLKVQGWLQLHKEMDFLWLTEKLFIPSNVNQKLIVIGPRNLIVYKFQERNMQCFQFLPPF